MPIRISRALAVASLVVGASAFAQQTAAQTVSAATSCLTCHATQQDVRLAAPASLFSQPDVHRESGFACIDCHGGDSAALDKARAHDTGHGFRGKPSGKA